jgi:tetratricopeptide (TPR) repeat protein
MKGLLLKRKIQKYERQRDIHGDDPVFFHDLAVFYRKDEQVEAAIDCYQDAIEAYYREDSRLGVNNEFILEVCWNLLEIDPLNILGHQTIGQELCGLNEFEEAARLYRSFATKLAQAGQYEEAITQYRNAFVLTPDDIKGRQQCFALLWKLRRKNEAVQELLKIAALAEQKGLTAKAVECYQKALKIRPSSPELKAELRRLVHTQRHQHNQLRLVVNNSA